MSLPEIEAGAPPGPVPEGMWQRVLAARDRLRGIVNRTPIVTSRTLDRQVSARVFLKCENFQRVGAFKFRGAYNAISRLTPEERARGVLTYSSGNHAQAVALAGRLLKVPTTVIMPVDAPVIKRMATEGYGAKVVEYDPAETTRREVAERLLAEGGQVLVPPFDHVDVIAGQGTAVLELFEELESLDLLLVPVGGGGLISGSAVAAKECDPACRVVGIEPEVAADATRSFSTRTMHVIRNPPTIADGTRTASLGQLTFPLILEHVDDMRTVTEEAIREAVRFLCQRLKLVVEPSGALGIAALLSGAVEAEGRVGVVISGGNIDGALLSSILAGN